MRFARSHCSRSRMRCPLLVTSSSAVLEQPGHCGRHVVVALDKRVSRFLGVKAHADELLDAGASASAARASLRALSARGRRFNSDEGGSCEPRVTHFGASPPAAASFGLAGARPRFGAGASA